MKQSTNPKAYDYEMPATVPYCLAHRSTWELWCRFGCQRSTFANMVTMIERHGLDFDGAFIEKRGICKACGSRLKITGGIHLDQIQACGELPTPAALDGHPFRRRAFSSPPHF